nr:MAG TPA: major capsid protein [Caudoviricetes sp.]
MALNMINRTNAEGLIPVQTVNEIIQNLPTESIFLSLARPLPRMTSKQQKVPVLTGLANASFLSGDTAKKPTTNLTWDNVFVTAEELAVIVPIPEAVLSDADYDIWAEVRPRLTEAFGRAIDAATFFGTNKPTSWPDGIVPAAIAAGNVAIHKNGATGTSLYQEIAGTEGLIAQVEDKGIAVTGYVGALQLRALLRGAVDNNGQPIYRPAYSNGNTSATPYELEGSAIRFPRNGAWDASQALLLAGNFDYARYAIRQDMTFKIFDQGTITDDDGKVVLSLMENDCVALRAVMRLGWALPKPVNPVSGTNYFPFAVLQTTNDELVSELTYSITKPVKSATPDSTVTGGTGYTGTIEWQPTADTFAASTVYTAVVTYTASDGYIFDDIKASDISGLPKTSDATSVTVQRVNDKTVTITVVYKATAA